MRFVSQYTNFVLNIQPGVKRNTEYGVEQIREDLMAEFDHQAWTQRDLETAVLAFKFRGVFQHEDEATPVHPAYRISVFDTDEKAVQHDWDEETKTLVETRMLAARGLGRDFVLVQELAVDPPWPSYDTFPGDAQALVEQALVLGYNLEEISAYESSKWGQQREDVIAELEGAMAARDAGEIIVT